MLNEYGLPKYFWTEAVHTACYVSNRVLVRPSLDKTPYELWHGKIQNIGYFKVFGCKCFILNNKEKLGINLFILIIQLIYVLMITNLIFFIDNFINLNRPYRRTWKNDSNAS